MSASTGMRWASAWSPRATLDAALEECVPELQAALGDGPVDLLLVFVSGSLTRHTERLREQLKQRLQAFTIAGVTARGVVTREHEVEGGSGLSLIAARLPDVAVRPFLLMPEVWREPIDDEQTFEQVAPGLRGAELVVLLGDPFSLDVERVLRLCDRFAPGVRIVGGLASAGLKPRENSLFLNDWQAHEGGIALAFHGAVRADIVVSQGCEPVGPPLDVTHVEQNIILTLDGQPALERAEQVLRELPESRRRSLEQGLYVGRPARGDASGRGDYLIRNLLGADRERGALAVADRIGPREKIRLHVRDAHAAVEDLEMLLSPQSFDTRASGALLFACNGRGRQLFGAPDRDISLLQQALGGGVPVAGMFAAGEIGPVGERNFLHGHTASIAILRPR